MILAVIYMVIMFLGFCALIHGICAAIQVRLTWKWDDRNPYRRYCRCCGNQQSYYVYNTSPQEIPIGWEFEGHVKACKKCKPDQSIVDVCKTY